MSRPRKPVQLRHGNPNKSKEELKEIQKREELMAIDVSFLDTPEEMFPNMQEREKKYYFFVLNYLKSAMPNVLASVDILTLHQISDCLSTIDECNEAIEQHGLFDTSARGLSKAHPAFQVKQSCFKTFDKLSSNLGLSPSSRAQLAQQATNTISTMKFANKLSDKGFTEGLWDKFQ
ncbi:phage terminase small subunit P27 family [Bacillus pseudomycoides]|nr:phage terminase small subunit P27 family [Bacillus pseudomycoides]